MNKNRIVVIVFIVLLAAAYLLRNPASLPWEENESAVFGGFEENKINRITVQESEEKTVFKKQGGKWVVADTGDFPADEAKVESLLSAVQNLQTREPVSNNKENHDKYGVSTTGAQITLSGGGEEYSLVVGSGTEFGKGYFRIAGRDEVYSAGEGLLLALGGGEWRDLRIGMKIENREMRNIRVENGNGKFVLEKKDKKWELVEPEAGKEIAQSRVEGLVSRLENLEAADATAEAGLEETGLFDPSVVVTVSNGKEEKLEIGGTENENSLRYAKVTGSPYIYLLAPSDYGIWEELNISYLTQTDIP